MKKVALLEEDLHSKETICAEYEARFVQVREAINADKQ